MMQTSWPWRHTPLHLNYSDFTVVYNSAVRKAGTPKGLVLYAVFYDPWNACGMCIQSCINFFRAWWPCLQSDQVHVCTRDGIFVLHWWCIVVRMHDASAWCVHVVGAPVSTNQPAAPHRGIQAVTPRRQPSCQMDEVRRFVSDLLLVLTTHIAFCFVQVIVTASSQR